MTVEYPDLSDYLAVASAVTGTEPAVVLASMKTDLADSALHAPAGSWSNEDFYPDFIDKAAVLLVRLAKNHPLLDGNKRAAWVTLRLFIEMNGWTWRTYPGVDEAEQRSSPSPAASGTRSARQPGSDRCSVLRRRLVGRWPGSGSED